ncbi:MAG: RNB domain-containing ribonuclease [Firmicutes bacterium]|nr:RNB domain-containing ribonuclease [Bacillota bacterium]
MKKKNNFQKDIRDTAVGVLQARRSGYAFLLSEGREDIFIPKYNMKNAIDGDEVLVRVISYRKGGGEGRVEKVLKRAKNKIVGEVKFRGDNYFLVADSLSASKDIIIEKHELGRAKDGDKVVVELSPWKMHEMPKGKVVELLGKKGQKGVDILSIIRSHGLYEKFPKGVVNEANEIGDTITDEEINGRHDFKKELVITIDGADARDFDDGVSVVRHDDGTYNLSVHIADVAHYVKRNSKIDIEAQKRTTSVYFPHMVLPMLPEKLSNGICSLKEKQDRLTLSVVMTVNKVGTVIDYKIYEGIINSRHRMTYEEVDRIIVGAVNDNPHNDYESTIGRSMTAPVSIVQKNKTNLDNNSSLNKMLFTMKSLADILTLKRINRGSIEFDLTESELVMDETGKCIAVVKKPRLISHKIIEEFMVLANETIAEHLTKNKIPGIFRVHESPPPEKIERLTDFLDALGVENDIDDNSTSLDFANLLKDTPEDVTLAVNKMALRSMSKALYENKNKGHFGLASEFYLHFTSPIRRYPDLIVHRILKDYLKNGKKNLAAFSEDTAPIAKQCSERERLAESAERDVVDYKKCEFMKDKVGNTYKGVVSGVAEWGIFVELENSVEGLIRIDGLPGYGYVFNEKTMTMSNAAYSFRLGQAVTVEVDSVTDRVQLILKT